MRLFLLVLMLSAGTWFSGFAQSTQKDSKFNFGLEADLPAGKTSSSYNAGVGSSLKYEYRADTNFYFTISAGYSRFQLTDAAIQAQQQAGSSRSSFGFLPIKIGGKFFISKGFFGEIQLGNTFAVNADRLDSAAASALTFSPGVGYVFDNGLELGARYEGWFTSNLFSQYSLRLAYRFKL